MLAANDASHARRHAFHLRHSPTTPTVAPLLFSRRGEVLPAPQPDQAPSSWEVRLHFASLWPRSASLSPPWRRICLPEPRVHHHGYGHTMMAPRGSTTMAWRRIHGSLRQIQNQRRRRDTQAPDLGLLQGRPISAMATNCSTAAHPLVLLLSSDLSP
ncbi:hypothetical protein VPH35_126777 [Triticum aestivum]